MTEREYIIARNRVRLAHTRLMLQELIQGEEYGVREQTAQVVLNLLDEMEDYVMTYIKLEDGAMEVKKYEP